MRVTGFGIILSLFTSLVSLRAQAQQDVNTLPINSNQILSIEYASAAANVDSQKIDTRSLIVRDKTTQKWILVHLQETDSNSGVFRASFQLGFQPENPGAGYVLEIYIPPTEIKDTQKLLQAGALPRKPYLVYRESDVYRLTVFDSADQLRSRYQERVQQLVQLGTLPKGAFGPILTQDKAGAIREAKRQADLAKQQSDAIEKSEQEKLVQRLQEQAALKQHEREERQAQAEKLSAQAMQAYQAEKFPPAAQLFQKATALDPANTAYLYQYGVCLYKTGNFTKSLAILDLATDPSVPINEKRYYQGLDLMKLKDLQRSWDELHRVQDSKDPQLSGIAAFFTGVIDFQTENYERAKSEFEFSLDNNKDPETDKQSETYLEQIASLLAFKQKQSKRWTTALAGGEMYDSNILNVATGQTATNLAGMRAFYQATAEYRFVYEYDHEFATQLGLSDYYSTTTGLKPNSSFQSVDPLSLSVYLPYRKRGDFGGQAGQLTVSPGYEAIYMDLYSTGGRPAIVNSAVVRTDWTPQLKDDRLVNYELELRRDISMIATAAADNYSAYKVTGIWTNTYFMDAKKERLAVFNVSLADNVADGSNQSYYQFGGDATYYTPWKWNTTASAKLGAYIAAYPTNVYGRGDQDLSGAVSLRKPITQTLAANFGSTFVYNNSSQSIYSYNKYTLSAMLSWLRDF